MEVELQHILGAVGSVYEKRDGVWLDRYMTVAGMPVVAVRSGMGLINAAAATERVINAHRPRMVLNYGCAGAHRRDIMPGDVIIGTCVAHHSAVQFLASGEERYVGFSYEAGSERREVLELACDAVLVQAAHQAATDHLPTPWPQDLHWPAAVPYRAHAFTPELLPQPTSGRSGPPDLTCSTVGTDRSARTWKRPQWPRCAPSIVCRS
jgi:hypothetical protein